MEFKANLVATTEQRPAAFCLSRQGGKAFSVRWRFRQIDMRPVFDEPGAGERLWRKVNAVRLHPLDKGADCLAPEPRAQAPV
jgi:hypothetical protein